MAWIEPVLTGAVVAVAVLCLARLALSVQRRRGGRHPLTDRNIDFAHALMGAGMAAMFASTTAVPARLGWACLFVATAVWLGFLVARGRPAGTYAHHAVASLAMAYMFAAARPHTGPHVMLTTTGHAGHQHGTAMMPAISAHPAGFAFPLVAWGLVSYCALSAGYAGTDLLRAAGHPACDLPAAQRRLAAPRLAAASELVLSGSMVYMFLAML
ncbi:hypothetical protein GCM10025787_59070 [Saccharopolyspora rosea]|uniref:DUF5134 domain-containing protein n=1 Tax=Saccharopolyspora rosea TaxID=524884 RepID=A0ABW3G243_9PSEU